MPNDRNMLFVPWNDSTTLETFDMITKLSKVLAEHTKHFTTRRVATCLFRTVGWLYKIGNR